MRNVKGLCQVCRYVDRKLLKEKGVYRCLLGAQKVREKPVDKCDWFYPSHLTESDNEETINETTAEI